MAQFGQSTTGGRVAAGQSSKADASLLGIVNFVFTEIDDLVEKTNDSDKLFEEIENNSDYEEKDGVYYGAIKYRLPDSSETKEEGLPIAFPLNRYNFTLPVKNETVYIQTINGKNFYTPISFQNTTGFNTNINILNASIKKTDESSTGGGVENYKEVSQTGIANSDVPTNTKSKTNKGFQGKYYKRNIKLHQLKPNEGDTIIQGKFGNSIRFSGYIHSDKIDGKQYPAILIRNGENADSQQNNKVFGTTIEDINKDGTSIQITSGEYSTLYDSTTIKVNKEAIAKYPSSDDLKGNQLVVNSGRLIFSSKTAETFLFSKKTFSIFTDDIVTIDTEKGFNLISQNGNVQLQTKGSKNIVLTVENGKIYAGKDGATQQMILGNTLVDLLTQLIDAINAMTIATPSGPSAPGPIDKSPFNQVKNNLKTALSKTNYLI
jgi:hypothetical protein